MSNVWRPPLAPSARASSHLTVDRVLEPGDVVVVTGEGRGQPRGGGEFRLADNDLFTFEGALIARVDSYVVPLG